MSLINCISKSGKSINKADADALEEEFHKLVEGGMDELAAGQAAIKSVSKKIDLELDDVTRQVEAIRGKAEPEEVKSSPLFVMRDDKLVDANEVMKELDDEISALDDIITCAFGGAV